MKNKDDNKIKKNETLSDTDLDKVAGGAGGLRICTCSDPKPKKFSAGNTVRVICTKCNGFISSYKTI